MTRTVLVVDDDVDSAEVLALLLRSDGHQVHVAADARSALALASSVTFELAFLDLVLDQTNGFELAAEWRRRYGDGTLLVALTGRDGEEVRESCRRSGFDCHLVKPILDFAGLHALTRSLEVPPPHRLR